MTSSTALKQMFFSNLKRLQSGITTDNQMLDIRLRTQLELLFEILGDEIPEEYWDQAEEEIDKLWIK